MARALHNPERLVKKLPQSKPYDEGNYDLSNLSTMGSFF